MDRWGCIVKSILSSLCICLIALTAYGFTCVGLSGIPPESCDQASDTTIIGQYDSTTGNSSKSIDDLFCTRTPVHYSGCPVDELIINTGGFSATEYVTAGIYPVGASVDPLGSTAQVEGNGTADRTFTFSSPVDLGNNSEVWICVHVGGGQVSFGYKSGLGADYETKTITGNTYSGGSMPTGLNLSSGSGTLGYAKAAKGRNP